MAGEKTTQKVGLCLRERCDVEVISIYVNVDEIDEQCEHEVYV